MSGVGPGDVVGVWMRPEWRLPQLSNPFEGRVIERTLDFDFESYKVETALQRVEEWQGLVERVVVHVTPALGDVVLPRIEWTAPIMHYGHEVEPEAFSKPVGRKVRRPAYRCASCGRELTRAELGPMGLR